MTQILERLCKFDYIDVVIFPEEVILEEPVEKWPLCDCLISFHSKGKSCKPKHLLHEEKCEGNAKVGGRQDWGILGLKPGLS